ncbi:MAG: metallopeptidase TldD-related protein [Thermoprotei archaeon]
MIELTSDALSYAQEHGAEYVEVRGETTEFLDVMVEDKGVIHSIGGLYNGVGIRAFYGSGKGYSSTSFITKTSIERAVEEAVRMAKASNFGSTKVKALEGRVENIKASMKQDPREVESEEKIKDLLGLVRGVGKSLSANYVRLHYIERYEDRTVATNYGLRLRGIKPSIWIGIEGYGGDGWNLIYEDGAVGGWETFKAIKKNLESFTQDLNTQPTDQEAESLVLSSRASSQLFGDAILPRFILPSESNYTRLPIASLNAVDDPTDQQAYGFMPFDDEGVQGIPKELIKEGNLVGALTTRTIDENGGRARAQDFVHEPGPANTFTKITFAEKDSLPQSYYYVPYIYSIGNYNTVSDLIIYSPMTTVFKSGSPVGGKRLMIKINLDKLKVTGVEGSFGAFGCVRELGGGLIPITQGSEATVIGGASLDRRPIGVSGRNGGIRRRKAGGRRS